MSLEATIQENTAALRDLIAVLAKGATPTAAQVEAVATEAKAEKASAKKTQAAATQELPTPTASDNSASSSPATPAAEPELQATNPTYQDAAGAITKLSRTKGRDAAVALLTKFGAAKLPDVKPEQFAAVIAAANIAMGE